jgi:hypothetical protein
MRASTESSLSGGPPRSTEVASVVGDAPDELFLEATEACPALAITVTDADTGEVVSP